MPTQVLQRNPIFETIPSQTDFLASSERHRHVQQHQQQFSRHNQFAINLNHFPVASQAFNGFQGLPRMPPYSWSNGIAGLGRVQQHYAALANYPRAMAAAAMAMAAAGGGANSNAFCKQPGEQVAKCESISFPSTASGMVVTTASEVSTGAVSSFHKYENTPSPSSSVEGFCRKTTIQQPDHGRLSSSSKSIDG